MAATLTSSAAAQVTWYVDAANCPGPGSGTLGDPYCAIQSAISAAAASGDTILVAPGTYSENVDFSFKSIETRSTGGPAVTIISAAPTGSALTFENGDCIFDGFTVTGGHNAIGGGGVNMIHNETVFTNCVFTGNSAAFIGGGFLNFGGHPILHNCLFYDNTTQDGGGFYNDHGTSTLINCTLVHNTASGAGGGAYVNTESITFHNCIFWDNSDSGGTDESAQLDTFGGTLFVNYSCIEGLDTLAGNNNVGDDPSFANPAADDFRLSFGSPVVDAGDNAVVTTATDLDGHARQIDDPNTTDTGSGTPPIVDLGCYEFDPPPVPTVSTWGLAVLLLTTLAAGSIAILRRHPVLASD